MRKLTSLLILIPVLASGANMDVRHFYVTNDISQAKQSVAPLKWYGGESVKLDLYVKRGSTAVSMTNAGTFAVWQAFISTNNSTAYLLKTGTLANATNGYITFDLEPGDANLPTNTYKSFVKVYEPVGGTNRYVGQVYATDLQILWGPNATNIVYQGPYTNSSEIDPIWIAAKTGVDAAILNASNRITAASNLAQQASDTAIVASNAAVQAQATADYSSNALPAKADDSTTLTMISSTTASGTLGTNMSFDVSDADTLDGYNSTDLMASPVVYYIFGSVAGSFTNPASKMAQLTSPYSLPVWTSTVTGASISNGYLLGYASVNTNEQPRFLSEGLVKVHLVCEQNKTATTRLIKPWLAIYESDMTTLVNSYSGTALAMPETKTHLDLDLSVTNETTITDSGRFIVCYFELTGGGWNGTETIKVYSQDSELTYIELPRGAGVFASQSDFNTHTGLTSTAHGGVALVGSYNTFATSNKFDGDILLGAAGKLYTDVQKGYIFDASNQPAFEWRGGYDRIIFDKDGVNVFSISATSNLLQEDGSAGIWRSEGSATSSTEIVNYERATNMLSTLNPQGFAVASAKIGASTNADLATVAVTSSNLTTDLTNYFRNAANQTNRYGSFCFQIISNTAPYNYAISAPLEYGIVITNLSAWEGSLVAFIGDVYTAGLTNLASRTLVYTGATYTAAAVAATNLPVSISVAAGRIVGCVVTNGGITNAFIMGQYTW